jgi:hypothetical protein
MATEDLEAIWCANAPREWPPPPEHMSVSRLLDIEACPRRWALSAAVYSDVWHGKGYPEKASKSAIAGRIVHFALEVLSDTLVKANCVSIVDPCFVNVMRKLGGFTQIIDRSITQVLAHYNNNPRVARSLDNLDAWCRDEIPHFRERIQNFIQRFRLQPSPSSPQTGTSAIRQTALQRGSHGEVTLGGNAMGWVGVADLLVLSPSACEIIDFKTGEPKPEHVFQMQVYSLLWLRDTDHNPNGRLATTLTLSYGDEDVSVPTLVPFEIEILENDLRERTRAAINAVRKEPPEAKPGPEVCRFCTVRHLCDVYWEPLTQLSLGNESGAASGVMESFTDLEVRVTEPLGQSSCNAIVTVSRSLPPGTPIRLYASPRELIFQDIFSSRGRIRILDASITREENNDSPIPLVSLRSSSEAFRTQEDHY